MRRRGGPGEPPRPGAWAEARPSRSTSSGSSSGRRNRSTAGNLRPEAGAVALADGAAGQHDPQRRVRAPSARRGRPGGRSTFASAASRIAQVLMTTRSAASIDGASRSRPPAAARPSPRSRSGSSGSPASRPRSAAASAPPAGTRRGGHLPAARARAIPPARQRAAGSRGRAARARPPGAQTSRRRWIRSIASARPVAGSTSIRAALKTTGPSPTSKRVGSAVDEARQDRRRVEPDDAVERAGHPEVAQVGRAPGEDPLVGRGDVGVGPDDRARRGRRGRCPKAFFSLVSSQWKSTRRTGGSGVGAFVEQPVGLRERVLDRDACTSGPGS